MPNAGRNLKAVMVSNLKASPVKSAILMLGTVVLIVLIARQVGGGPDAASASDGAVAVSGEESSEDGDKATIIKPVVRVPRPRIIETLARDPFGMDWLDMSRVGRVEVESDVEDDVLQLQLTLTGKDESGRAAAVVSGTVVHVGDQIAGFVIDRIEKRSVVLRKGSEKLKLRMP